MENQYGIQAAYIIIASAVCVVLVVRSFTDYILKRKLIEQGYLREQSYRKLNEYFFHDYSAALKWGLIALFTGLGLIVLEWLPDSRNSSLPYGIVLVFVATGFLVYYALVNRQLKRPPRSDEETK